jgi:threonine/homoserine/homoserine lactone efflux protein
MSSYYGLAVAVGIPGTILFYLALVSGLLKPLARYRRDLRLMALCGMVVAGLLVGITESAIYSVGNCFAYLFWMGFALMIRRTVYRMRRVPMTAGGALKRLVGKERPRRLRRIAGSAVVGRSSRPLAKSWEIGTILK